MNNRQLYIVFIFLISVFSCNNTAGSHASKENGIVKDLNYHLKLALKEIENSQGVEQKFNDEVYLRGFAFYEKDQNHYDLILELQDDITDEVVSKYTFTVEGFVEDDQLHKLSDYAKSKNRTYEAWFVAPELKKVNNRCYVILDVVTKLEKLSVMKFFLFDKDGYQGDLSERILVYDYKIK